MLSLIPVPALQDNYIWTLATGDRGALVVDPGDAAALDADIAINAILITHHHPDHIGGLSELLRRQPATPVYAPVDARIPGDYVRVVDGDSVSITGLASPFRVMHLPGHTLTHIAYVDDQRVFCGDTLFSLGCGRMFEGTPTQMLRSLDRIAALPAETLLCCTHEYTADNARFALQVDPDNEDLQHRVDVVQRQRQTGLPTVPTTIGEERRCNPFLRVDTPAVRRAVERWLGRSTVDRVDVFAGLRQMKDRFQ